MSACIKEESKALGGISKIYVLQIMLKINESMLMLKDVLVIPDLECSLVSVGKCPQSKLRVLDGERREIIDKINNSTLTTTYKKGMFVLSATPIKLSSASIAGFASSSSSAVSSADKQDSVSTGIGGDKRWKVYCTCDWMHQSLCVLL
ncbi:hypothetical protein BDZ91DRAFT_708312 [Kalaharituber pfeilii]|nr:hypothetical protein BDZ91DRAFT_708312 [Kalaharituber pfeilii]